LTLPANTRGTAKYFCVRDLGLARVAVLGDEVASEAGEVVVLDDLNATLAAGDRFAGAGK